MKQLIYCLILYSLVTIQVFSQNSPDDLDIIFKQDFEHNTLGDYRYSEWTSDWLNPEWSNRQSELDIVSDPTDFTNPSKAMEINFPAHSLGPEEGGTHWPTDLTSKHDEVYYSYDIMFMPDFEFQWGGKMPGLRGGSPPEDGLPNGYDGFIISMMFKDDRPSFYIYYPDSFEPEYGASFEWGRSYTQSEFGSSKVKLEYTKGSICHMGTGEWHNLTMRIVLNTVTSDNVGNYDGILEAYFDGELVTQLSHLQFRKTNSLKVDKIKMMSFFGGATDDWRNPIYEWLRIDNVFLYTFKSSIDVPRGNTLSPTSRKINYWRKMQDDATSLPAAPTNLIASNVTKNSVSLKWTDNSTNEVGFEIQRSSSPSSGFTKIGVTTANNTTFTNSGLSLNTTYYYRVMAINSKGKSDASNTLSVKTLPLQTPVAPSGLEVESALKNSGTIKWNDNSNNEIGFEIYSSTNATTNFTKIGTVPANSIKFTQSPLTPNTTYYYKVLAYNGDGSSAFSNTISLTTLPYNYPAAPSNLTTESPDISQVFVQWKDNSDIEDGFEVEKSEGDLEHFNLLTKVTQNQTSVYDRNILSPVNYYRVRAYNSDGYSGYSDTLLVQFVINEIPDAPSQLNITSIGYDKAVLKWKDNSLNETGFEIERHGPNNDKIVSFFTASTNDTTFVDSRLTMNSEYIYYIRSFNGKGYSGYSNKVIVKTLNLEPPQKPTNLNISNTTQESLQIRWVDQSNNESAFYLIRMLASDTNNFKLITLDPNITDFIDENLSPATNYIYKIFASNPAGNSDFSNKAIGYTLSVSEEKRTKEGLVAYYNFSFDPAMVVHDKSNYQQPLELYANNSDNVKWSGNNSIELKSGASLKSQYTASKITQAFKKSNELSIECWIKPGKPDIDESSRIISLTDPEGNLAFALDQNFSNVDSKPVFNYNVKLKTSSTDDSGFPQFWLSQNIEYINLLHLVYTRDSMSNEKLYLDGSLISENYRPGGLFNWGDNYNLYLGNSANQLDAWQGSFYTVAFYNKSLSFNQILRNYSAGPTENIIVNENDYTINITPNPIHGEAVIDIIPSQIQDLTDETIIRIVDLLGRKHYEQMIFDPSAGFSLNMDFSAFTKGVYLLELITKNGVKSKKFIIK